MKKNRIAFALLLIGTALCCSVKAQTMYRCGSTYQDQPCSGREQGKVVGSTGSSSSSQPAAIPDAECARMGEDSKKIIWAREAGAIKEDAMSRAKSSRERDLVERVYMRRGSAPEISAAIAADCVSEKERAAQAAALIQEAQRLAPSRYASASEAAPNDQAVRQRDAAPVSQNRAAEDSQAKQRHCDDLKERLEDIRNQQRRGGSTAAMESLSQMQRDAQSALNSAHCQ